MKERRDYSCALFDGRGRVVAMIFGGTRDGKGATSHVRGRAPPIDNLAESLLANNPEYQTADTEERKIKRTIFSTLLKSSSLGLVEAIEQHRARQTDANSLKDRARRRLQEHRVQLLVSK